MSKNIFGNKFREWRELNRMTLQECANLLNTSHSFLSQIETGKKSPSFEMLEKMRKNLGIDLNNFIASDLSGIVREKLLDYQYDRTKELSVTLKRVIELTDEIKTTVKEGIKKAKLPE
jgi:transcriptional regulator with XRE-family HTH domain